MPVPELVSKHFHNAIISEEPDAVYKLKSNQPIRFLGKSWTPKELRQALQTLSRDICEPLIADTEAKLQIELQSLLNCHK